MAKTVQGVEERLRKLYSLQLIDSQIDEIQILKGELPIEVGDLEDEIAGLETRVAKLMERVSDSERDISNHNHNIKQSEMLIERYNKQLDEVKNNREFEALTKEIELQKLEIQLSQKKMGEVTVQKDAKLATLNEASERLSAKKDNLSQKKVELSKILEKTDVEEEKLRASSDKARQEISDVLIKSYDKIRGRYRNGLAVVTVERDACGGCFNRIPPQVQIEIGLYKNVMACEHCGRVLVDEILADEMKDKHQPA